MKKFIGILKIFLKNKKEEIRYWVNYDFGDSFLGNILTLILYTFLIFFILFLISCVVGGVGYLLYLSDVFTMQEFILLGKNQAMPIENFYIFWFWIQSSLVYFLFGLMFMCAISLISFILYRFVKGCVIFVIWIKDNIIRAIKEYEELEKEKNEQC